MKKPQITRIQSQLRQVRTRAARHCQVRTHDQIELHSAINKIEGPRQKKQGSSSGREETTY